MPPQLLAFFKPWILQGYSYSASVTMNGFCDLSPGTSVTHGGQLGVEPLLNTKSQALVYAFSCYPHKVTARMASSAITPPNLRPTYKNTKLETAHHPQICSDLLLLDLPCAVIISLSWRIQPSW